METVDELGSSSSLAKDGPGDDSSGGAVSCDLRDGWCLSGCFVESRMKKPLFVSPARALSTNYESVRDGCESGFTSRMMDASSVV